MFHLFFQLFVIYNSTKYSAIAGDGGPNVQSAKIKITAHFPWILNIYDPCHNLNLFLKDLGKLFKDVNCFISFKGIVLMHYSIDACCCFRNCELLWKIKLWYILSGCSIKI